jgi:hypothetical protein
MSKNKTYVEADWAAGDVTAPYPLNWRGGPLVCRLPLLGQSILILNPAIAICKTLPLLLSGLLIARIMLASPQAAGVHLTQSLDSFASNVNSFTTGATVSIGITQTDAI